MVHKMIKQAVIIGLLIYGLTVMSFDVNAAPLENIPHTINQPNGETVECFVSGDEHFNYMHDARSEERRVGKECL